MADLEPALLVERLGSLLTTPPLSIEVIPGDGSEWFSEGEYHASHNLTDHAPFLYMEHNLGVPHKVLYKTYLAVVPLFAQEKRKLDLSEAKRVTPGYSTTDLTYSSAILLLANPAHQTALNARKRLVRSAELDAAQELRFITALLGVRNCSKQSILWHHRRWLLRRIYRHSASGDAPSPPSGSPPHLDDHSDTLRELALPLETLRDELFIVVRACETYNRNYFAWMHRDLCLEALVARLRARPPDADLYRALLAEELQAATQWVERHVSDYTAVQYLRCAHDAAAHLFNESPRALPSACEHGSAGCPAVSAHSASLLPHARSLVQAYPDHESLWLYLRAALAAPADPPEDLHAFARRFLLPHTADEKKARLLSAGSAQLAHGHACRFLAWLAVKERTLATEGELVRRVVRADGDDHELLRMLGVEAR